MGSVFQVPYYNHFYINTNLVCRFYIRNRLSSTKFYYLICNLLLKKITLNSSTEERTQPKFVAIGNYVRTYLGQLTNRNTVPYLWIFIVYHELKN